MLPQTDWIPEGAPPALRRCLEEWSILQMRDAYKPLLEGKERFKVVAAGRRSGKTLIAKRYMALQVLDPANAGNRYFIGGPIYHQTSEMYWQDMGTLLFMSLFPAECIRKGDRVYVLPNGTELHIVGLDEPRRIEGQDWDGGIIDEIADIKPTAWEYNLLPALSTKRPDKPGYKPWCWLVGVPEGRNHYYRMAQMGLDPAEPEWGTYTWPSSVWMDEADLAAKRRQMSERAFRQEYEATFEEATGRVYADYSAANYTGARVRHDEPLLWSHDFNNVPMSSVVAALRGEEVYCLDEIVLDNATARHAALEFVNRYEAHQQKTVTLFGDASGTQRAGHTSNYAEMANILRGHGWRVIQQVPNANPPIVDRQNALRGRIKAADGVVRLFVNRGACPVLHQCLDELQYKRKRIEGEMKQASQFLEDDTAYYSHVGVALGYMAHRLFRVTEEREPEPPPRLNLRTARPFKIR